MHKISALCNGITGTVSPFVVFNPKNVTDPNAQYHDFRVDTTDYRPDWYFETMVEMRYLARVGFVGYTKKTIQSMASSGSSVGVYNGHVYDVTSYINSPPGRRGPPNTVAPDVPTDFMDQSVLDVFTFSGGGDVTKQLDNLNIDRDTLARQKSVLAESLLDRYGRQP